VSVFKVNTPEMYIFDCDGVLIDSWESTRLFYQSIRDDLGLGPISDQDMAFLFVSTIEEGLERIVPGEWRDRARHLARSFDVDRVLPYIQTQPGVIDFLAALNRAGWPTAVDTNGASEARAILRALDLDHRFNWIVTSDDVERPKPHPEGIGRILDAAGRRPNQAVFIGDSSVDRDTARAAGVAFWAYRQPALVADRHVEDFYALAAEIESVQGR
jgi:HAD superfamily hydrolase (TIGR01509 family)